MFFKLSICISLINLIFVQADKCKSQNVFSPLPGNGWDVLQNKEMSRVVLFNYDNCQETSDGYLIPDTVQVFPVQKSGLQMFSEIIDHWKDFTSVTANSFSMNGGYKAIKGSFSNEFQTLKGHQVKENAVTFRSSARYVVHSLGVEQSSLVSLEPSFIALINDAASSFESDNEEKADLLLELLVFNYGTHVTTRIDAGACLLKEDFLTRSFMAMNAENRKEIAAAASMSFFSSFQFGSSFNRSSSSTNRTEINRSTTSSSITSLGGALVRPNDEIDVWIGTIPENLVTIDRDGIPLPNLITPYAFPHINLTTLGWVRSKLEKVIQEYYDANTREGCMDEDSANFDYNANVENAEVCTVPSNNYTFGGVFQICESSISTFCTTNYTVNNINTGRPTCPLGYEKVLLTSTTITRQHCVDSCFFCSPVCRQVPIIYSAYWCAGKPGPNIANEFLFGGVYSSVKENMQTLSKSCPPNFEVAVLQDLKICIGNDFELGRKYSVPFGGFFSCSSGNHFANSSKGCPPGFSQHMAVIQSDCMVNYCVKANAMGLQPFSIVSPPFKKFDVLFEEEEIHEIFSQRKGLGPRSAGNSVPNGPSSVLQFYHIIILGLTMIYAV